MRIQFRGFQKKTKKNVNCVNPKFYEIFRFPLSENEAIDQFLIIQVILVEQKDEWKMLAQTFINIKDFAD